MMLMAKLLYLLCFFVIISAQNQINVTEIPSTTYITDGQTQNESSTLVGETFYSRINNKLPSVEETGSLPTWFHTKQLIFLLSGVGVCCVLLIGFSLPKYCRNYTETRGGNQSHQLLMEPENREEASLEEQTLLPSDDEEFTTPPILRIN